jgi:hypothetical protein
VRTLRCPCETRWRTPERPAPPVTGVCALAKARAMRRGRKCPGLRRGTLRSAGRAVGATRSSGESAREEGVQSFIIACPRGCAVAGRASSVAEAGSALEGRTPGGHRPRAVFGRLAARTLRGEKSSEGRTSRGAPKGARPGRERSRARGPRERLEPPGEEQSPEGENPRSVTGMKQARAGSRGASRRGRAKRRGRKVAGEASPRRPNPRPFMR